MDRRRMKQYIDVVATDSSVAVYKIQPADAKCCLAK